MLTADDLQLLQAIAQTGSLSSAAQHLGKAVSTVSHAARQLEERMDALLFDRSGYRIALTPAGQVLVEQGALLYQQSQRLTQRVQQVARGWEARLHLVLDELINFQALLPVIRDFDNLQSGVQLRFMHATLGGTWEALVDQRADLVIGATNEPPAIARLHWHELGRLQWVFAVSPRHPLASIGGSLVSAQIAEHRAVVVADSARLSNQRSYGVGRTQSVLAMPSMRAKIAAQVAGLGVGWLPAAHIAAELKSGQLVVKTTEEPREPNMLYVGWVQDKTGPALSWWADKLTNPRLARALLKN